MKKTWLLAGSLLLAGCSLDPDAAQKYVTEEKLEAVIAVSGDRIQVETSPDADVSVFFWQDGEQSKPLAVIEEAEGVFTADQPMSEDGIYFVKADIQTDGQHIMPTKKVVIGDVAEPEEDKPAADVESHH